ncbi:MAG: alpha/beta fold hydrolase [Candidatus Blackburnbacteria bacterium]|nr:alpha/beta fold hydrolase [Candidatus Blackburnbacteria bacterium]
MSKITTLTLFIFAIVISGTFGWWVGKNQEKTTRALPKTITERLRPLEKYSIENLSKRTITPSEIKIEKELQAKTTAVKNPIFKSYLFSYISEGKKVSGQVNIPSGSGSFPAVVMYRGYIDQNEYTTGMGTRNTASVLAQNGFVTFAPDFLGYGESDPINPDVIPARFETYTTALDMLSAVENGKFVSDNPNIENFKLKIKNLFLWGHSNGGHIALAVLEITQKEIPTVLWAPVTKPFPYSILYFTDESEDHGKFLRRQIANFEEDYDINLYSIDTYFDRINAPIELHQGTLDVAVPKRWSDSFVNTLKKKEKKITYFVYPGADHDLKPSWDIIVNRTLAFYNKHLK